MLGKIIGGVCFILAIVALLSGAGIYIAVTLFISGAVFWMLGVYQSSLEKIEYFTEWQKDILIRQNEQSSEIIRILKKMAGELGTEQPVENKEVDDSN